MKIKTKKGSGLYDTKPSDTSLGNWASTDPAKFRKLAKQAKFESRRAPEIWVKDGESRLLRFVDDDACASFRAYRFKMNNQWSKEVAPSEGDEDLLGGVLGMRASRVFVFRVIDVSGFTTKKGKPITNVPRFLIAGARMYEQIKLMAEESEGSICDFNVKMTRSGTQTNTVYSFWPKQQSAMTPDMKKAVSQFPNWTDYYAPVTMSRQRAIVSALGGRTENDES